MALIVELLVGKFCSRMGEAGGLNLGGAVGDSSIRFGKENVEGLNRSPLIAEPCGTCEVALIIELAQFPSDCASWPVHLGQFRNA